MNVIDYLRAPIEFSSPPAGAVNVLRGDPIEGPGGRWVPCATKISDGVYYASLFKVGRGQKQVCAITEVLRDPQDALVRARTFAASAAA